MPRVHVLQRSQRLGVPIERAFEFYGEARNLEAITPPWLGFEVTNPGAIEMRAGTLIDYRLKLHGVHVRWRTRIEAWEPPCASSTPSCAGRTRCGSTRTPSSATASTR